MFYEFFNEHTVYNFKEILLLNQLPDWPVGNITFEIATSWCRTKIQASAAIQTCAVNYAIDIETELENCVTDIQVS